MSVPENEEKWVNPMRKALFLQYVWNQNSQLGRTAAVLTDQVTLQWKLDLVDLTEKNQPAA